MGQTVTAVQTPGLWGRIDGNNKYASYMFIVKSGVTVNVGDIVYFDSGGGYITAATASGATSLLGMAEQTVVGNGTLTCLVCIDPMMIYVLKANAALAPTTDVGQYVDLTGGAGAQLINKSGGMSATTGQFLLLAVGGGTENRVNGGLAGINTTSYGLFKLVEHAFSPQVS